jgi:hypothetical protein
MLQEVSSELSQPTEMKEETKEKPMGLMSRSLPDGD